MERFLVPNLCYWYYIKVAGDTFRSSVCIYEKSMHEVRWPMPKMREIFTNRLRNVSTSITARAKRFLVNYTISQRIVLLHEVLTIARGFKLELKIHFCIRVCSEAFGSVKTSNFCFQEFSEDIEFHEMTRQGGKLGVL